MIFLSWLWTASWTDYFPEVQDRRPLRRVWCNSYRAVCRVLWWGGDCLSGPHKRTPWAPAEVRGTRPIVAWTIS